MTITHQASTGVLTATTAQGTTSCAVAYPTGVAAGRIAVMFVSVKLSTATFNAVSGWTLVGEATGGTGTSANDAGTTRLGVWVRVLVGNETGSVTVTNNGGVSCAGAMTIYNGTTGGWESPLLFVTGADTTHGTNPSAACTSWSSPLAAGDWAVWGFSNDTDTAKAPTSPTITQTGATFGTVTHRNQTLSSSGTDSGVNSFDASVTTGTGNAPTVGFTSAVSQCGAFVVVRLRELVVQSVNATPGTLAATTTIPTPARGVILSVGTLQATSKVGPAGTVRTFGAVTSGSLNGLLPLTDYQIQIRSRDAAGNRSAYSSLVSFSTSSNTVSPPTLAATTSFATPVVKYSRTQFFSNTFGTLTGLVPGGNYQIQVRARDSIGNVSAYSTPTVDFTLSGNFVQTLQARASIPQLRGSQYVTLQPDTLAGTTSFGTPTLETVQTHQGAVSLGATATLTSNGVRATAGAVSLAASATFSAGTGALGGAANLSASSALSANGIRSTDGAVALSAVSTLTANATVILSGFGSTPFGSTPFGGDTVSAAPILVTAVLTVGANLSTTADVALVAGAVLAAQPIVDVPAAVSLGASATLSAAVGGVSGSAALTAGSTLSVAGLRTTTGDVSLVVGSTLSSAGSLTAFAAVSLGISSILTADGVRVVSGAVSLVSVATLTSDGITTGFAVVSLGATATLTSAGIRTTSGAVSLPATVVLTSNGVVIAAGLGATLASTPVLTIAGRLTAFAAVSLGAVGTLTAGVSLRVTVGSVSLSVLGSLTVSGGIIVSGSVSLVVGKVLNVDGISGKLGAASLTSSQVLSIAGLVIRFGVAQLDVTPQLSALGLASGLGSVSLSALTGLALQGTIVKIAAAVLLASANFGVSQFANVGAVAYLTATALLQYVDIFPQIVFGAAPGGWTTQGMQTVRSRNGWITDGIHAASTRAWS